MQIIWTPSPNFSERLGQKIDMIIIHHTDMSCVDAALERLCNPETEVSCHYLISKTGAIYQLVHDKDRAWHAGRINAWKDMELLNSRSIGIELDNAGYSGGLEPFPHAQMDVLLTLLKSLTTKYQIPPHHILGHSDIAPDRKKDPGELFDWSLLAQNGYGLWPQTWLTNEPILSEEEANLMLSKIGYKGATTQSILFAFQRHFTPSNITGTICQQTSDAIRSVARIA